MKIKIKDIPAEGRDLEFNSSCESLNERVNAGSRIRESKTARSPEYLFHADPSARLRLELHGRSVSVRGHASAKFEVACSRCAEPIERELEADIDLILKPRAMSGKTIDEFEDLGFGFHDGQEVDCTDIVEEYLILQLPYTVSCAAESIAQCEKAQSAAKYYSSEGSDAATELEGGGDERFAIFKTLKVNGKSTTKH